MDFAKMLGGFIAVAGALLLVKLIIGLLRTSFFGVTGQLKLLERKDDGRDEPGRMVSDRAEMTRESFKAATGDLCPLHNSPYIGYTRFKLDESYRVVIGCAECMQQALEHVDFIWSRKNYDQHPVWAGAQLYPHLVGDSRAAIKAPFVAFDDPRAQDLAETWIKSDDLRARRWGRGSSIPQDTWKRGSSARSPCG